MTGGLGIGLLMWAVVGTWLAYVREVARDAAQHEHDAA